MILVSLCSRLVVSLFTLLTQSIRLILQMFARLTDIFSSSPPSLFLSVGFFLISFFGYTTMCWILEPLLVVLDSSLVSAELFLSEVLSTNIYLDTCDTTDEQQKDSRQEDKSIDWWTSWKNCNWSFKCCGNFLLDCFIWILFWPVLVIGMSLKRWFSKPNFVFNTGR